MTCEDEAGNRFFGLSQFTTLCNPHVQDRPLALAPPTGPSGSSVFNHPDDFHALVVGDLTKNDVFIVQMRGRGTGDEKLASVGVGAGIGHGQQTGRGVFVLEGFVGERGVVVDACAAGAVGVEKVAALDHEVFDLEHIRTNAVSECRMNDEGVNDGVSEWVGDGLGAWTAEGSKTTGVERDSLR